MLGYVCLFALIASITAQGTPNTIIPSGPQSLPSIPAGASPLGTVAAASGIQQSGPLALPANQLTGAFPVQTMFNPQQMPSFVGQQTVGQPVNPASVSVPFGAQPAAQPSQPSGSPVPPPSVGPLASLAAQRTLANSLVPSTSSNPLMNPLLLALGGSDNFLPYYLMSQPGLLQRNPLMGMIMMKNM